MKYWNKLDFFFFLFVFNEVASVNSKVELENFKRNEIQINKGSFFVKKVVP